jgi:hypothetical protein
VLLLPALADSNRLSTKFYGISADSQLWRKAYYNRFVRPRAARVRGTPLSSKLLNWLDEDGLIRRGQDTNWKRQYKLRHNWSRGACDVSEILVAEERPLPPLLVKQHDGIVYTSDSVSGMTAWCFKKEKTFLATLSYNEKLPTSLAIDTSDPNTGTHQIVVGFNDGSFSIVTFHKEANAFRLKYEHEASSNGMLLEMSCHSGFLMTMTASQLFSVYKLSKATNGKTYKPLLLHSLRSQTIWNPISLSIRASKDNAITATIAYSVPTLLNWAVGVQELRFDLDTGDLLVNRMATSSSGPVNTLGSVLAASNTGRPIARPLSPFPATGAFAAAAPGFAKPTSLSYTHPYLLLSHSDNTLTTFLVTSTNDELKVSIPTRLWGHTSSVSGAHVEGKGKAVSVTERGDELRIWELEGMGRRQGCFTTHHEIDRNHANSVRITPGTRNAPTPLLRDDEEDGVIRGWVSFDDDSIVILKERNIGRQDLLVYDFA